MSTPKTLNSNSDRIVNKENTPTNDSHVTIIEEYLNKQYNHAALVHLNNQIMKEVSKEQENNGREIKRNSPEAYEALSSFRWQIEILQREVYLFERWNYWEKTLIKSLIARYTLSIEHKEHTNKALKNESTIDE